MLERAAGLVQWGALRWRKAGIAVMTQPLDAEIVDKVAAARLAGVISTDPNRAHLDKARARAAARRLYMGVVNEWPGVSQ